MSQPHPARMTSTTLLSATLMSLCGIGQAASAPVLTGASFALDGIIEDASQAVLLGNTFNDQLFPIYSDPGANFRGVAVVAINGTHGKWQYTSFEQFGTSTQWFDIPLTISANNALLLAIGTVQYSAVRFVPDADFNTQSLPAPTITVRAWNGADTGFSATSDAAKVFGDASVNGGTSSYSAVAALASVTVAPVQDAPVLSVTGQSLLGAFPSASGISGSIATATFLAAGANAGTAPITDVDDNALQGIAIVGADRTNGAWQYTVDGTTFLNFPATLDDSHAVLLAAVTDGYTAATGMAVRFQPSFRFRGTATFTYRAWDQSQHDSVQNSGRTDVDVSANGGASPYSSAVRTATIQILNSAPAMTPSSSTLPDLAQDAAANTIAGVTLASLFAGSFSDPNFDPEGAAITGADNTHGTWQFTLDNSLGGASPWTDMGALSASQALLLHFAASTYNTTTTAIRFVPAAGFNTATNAAPTITLRAWDETLGGSSANAEPVTADLATDRAVNGSASAFGATDIVLTQAVTGSGVNVAPVLVSGAGNLGTVTNAVAGQVAAITVDDIISAAGNGGTAPLTDADGNTLGIAITAADSSHGTWEFFTSQGSFAPFPVVTASSALILGSGIAVRFVPKGDFAGTAAITYRGWDGTDASATGAVVDPGVGGGSTAFSTASRTAAFAVTSSPFTEITDTSGSGLQAVVATLLAPGSQITVDTQSITFVGVTTPGGAQASTVSAIDFGTAADGTHMTIAGSGLLLTSGDGTPNLSNPDAANIASAESGSIDLVTAGDTDLDTVVGSSGTNDASSLSFSFTVPTGIHSVSFQMMFGSEEFPQFINSFTDGAAVFVDGVNVAIFNNDPSQFLHVSTAISSLIESNDTASNLGIEYNGVTRPATVIGVLNPSLTTHTIKIVTADSGDSSIDSGLFISSLAGSTATIGGGIVVIPPGPPGSRNVAHVTVPPIGISSGSSVIYASVCPSTAEGIANLSGRLAGKPKNQVRAFAWDGSAQTYVELPDVPTGGLTDSTGVFIATRLDLGLDFSGTPTAFPFDIVLHPGFNFVGVPPLGTLSSFSTVHQFPADFTLFDGTITVTDPLEIANLIGTPGGDITTARPFFWDGSAYVQEAALTTGAGYWIKNNSGVDITLTRVTSQITSPGNTLLSASASVVTRSSAVAANVHDRGVPPPPPGGSTSGAGSSAASGSGGAKSCGLGSGLAAFASMLMLALRRRLREGRKD
ncbi:MAG: choice-of-anchor L domain-containing protein [Planctomycetes bacterium]|nr:choice-of-anchor L domain-containing protein [Planctomycetota bacterium]